MNTVSNLFIKNIPEIKDREFKCRTQMDSHELNELQQESFKDILDLFNKANLLQRQLYEFNEASGIESMVYGKRLTEAMLEVEQVKELYDNLRKNGEEFRYQSKFAYEAETLEDGYKAIINKETNDITANVVSSVSKTHIYDSTYDEILVPDSIEAYIGPDNFTVGNNIYIIEDSDIKNIFDTTDSNVWHRKVVTSTNIESIENEVIIALPEDIVTTRLVNEIVLKPFPLGHVDIMDVQYKTNGAWTTVPGFLNHKDCTEETYTDTFGNEHTRKVIKNSGNLRFNFKAAQMNQLKIKIRQTNFDYDPATNKRTWYLGIRNVDALYNHYTNDNSIFTQVFTFPETDRVIKVYDTELFYNNQTTSGLEFGVTKEYYYFDSDGNYHRISGSTPFLLNGHKLMVKFFIEGTEETPNIYLTRVKYRLD